MEFQTFNMKEQDFISTPVLIITANLQHLDAFELTARQTGNDRGSYIVLAGISNSNPDARTPEAISHNQAAERKQRDRKISNERDGKEYS